MAEVIKIKLTDLQGSSKKLSLTSKFQILETFFLKEKNCGHECGACMFMLVYLQRSQESTGSTGSTVMYGCEQSCGCWEPNLGHLEEQILISNTKLLLIN